jgi:hypothetical protein
VGPDLVITIVINIIKTIAIAQELKKEMRVHVHTEFGW